MLYLRDGEAADVGLVQPLAAEDPHRIEAVDSLEDLGHTLAITRHVRIKGGHGRAVLLSDPKARDGIDDLLDLVDLDCKSTDRREVVSLAHPFPLDEDLVIIVVAVCETEDSRPRPSHIVKVVPEILATDQKILFDAVIPLQGAVVLHAVDLLLVGINDMCVVQFHTLQIN